MLWSGVVVAVLSGAAGFEGANWVLRRAKRAGLVQAPNERSSHRQPTATGGGLGIVLGGTIACVFLASFSIWPAILVLIASLAMAAIGLRDDIKTVPWTTRLGVQVLVVGILLVAGVPLPELQAAIGLPLPLPILAVAALAAGIVWVNFYNFMDGIDGLAGSEAVFLLLAAAGLTLLGVPGAIDLPLFWWIVALAAAPLGFLGVNWPPARIFMGDTGSTYLGLMIGFLALVTITLGWVSLPQWLILVALFVTDAGVTLVRRLVRRERIFEGHRQHAYQHLTRRWKSHRRVTVAFIGINVALLLPLALVAGRYADWAYLPVLAAYLPLAAGALLAGAGAPERKA